MLTEFVCKWNPLNLYGIEIDLEDLICSPLQSNETLREDCCGNYRRIKVPSSSSSFWEKCVFWLQTHLNKKGHVEAINKLISLFDEKLLQNPPQIAEKLQQFNWQIDQLRSLKNDYGFTSLKQGTSSFIESRLLAIEQHAYSIFAYYHQKQVIEEENVRKKAFLLFQEEIDQKLEELALRYFVGLQKARLLILSSSDALQVLFEERVQSLQNRLKIVQDLQQQIDEMEKVHQGKFTIPCIKDYFYTIRKRVCHEVRKIGIEAENVIRNLLVNYRIAPFREEVKLLLYSMRIDPDKIRLEDINTMPFSEELNDEILRIQHVLKFFF